MSTSDIYCASCGASNDLNAAVCFACAKTLVRSDDDDRALLFSGGALLQNRYLLHNPVGEGGFATVYRAEDTLTGRTVAIKSIGLASLNAQQMIEATDTYNREVLFGRALKHAHLPTFYNSFTDRDHWYLVVQFIDGLTLEAYVQQRPNQHLALWEALDIGIQICDVLTYLHTRHPPIIFRDIKPDNIMRDSNGEVYLIDFGIARHFREGQRRDTHLLGSPGYAAPEQYGSAQTNERSDIYSLGATLQMLLTGRNPLDDKDDKDDHASFMDQEVAALLERMQAQKPEDRPANAQEVSNALQDIARQRGISQLVPALQKIQGPERLRALVPSSSLAAHMAPYTSYVPSPPPPTRRKGSAAGWLTGGLISAVLLLIFSAVSHPSGSLPVPSRVSNAPTLTIGAIGDTFNGGEGLNPTLPLSLQNLQVEELLYSGLTTVNSQNQLRAGLAQSWDAQPDSTTGGLNWTFHLRPNLKFSDGSPLTSADIAYTIDRVFSLPNTDYGYLAQYFKDGNDRLKGKVQTLIGDSLIVPNPSTLIIKGSGVFLPALMSTNCFLVVNKVLIGKYGSRFTEHLNEGGASGPFMQVASINENEADLALNPYYYDQRAYGQKTQINRISVQFFSTVNDERGAYDSNILSMMTSPSDALTPEEQNDVQTSLVSTIQYLSMNYLTKPFDNIKIRQAFALALDKVAIMDSAYKAGNLATNHIIPLGQWGSSVSLSGPTGVNSLHGDARLAEQLLQSGMREEGIPSIQQFPSVTLSYNNGDDTAVQNEMTLIQSQWKNALGINVKLDNEPDYQFNEKMNGSANNTHGLQLWFSGWKGDYPDPQNWTTLQFSKGSVWNTMNYGQNASKDATTQQRVQANLLKADTMQNAGQRLEAYQIAEQQLVDDVAWLPISQNNAAELVKPSVHGYQINGSGIATPDIVEAMSID